MKLYLDTNVIMDFLRARNSATYYLLMRALRCEHELVLSELTIQELLRHHKRGDIRTFVLFAEASGKLQLVRSDSVDRSDAKHLPTHYADALHYTLAVRYADAFVTCNSKDFPFTTIPVVRPEHI